MSEQPTQDPATILALYASTAATTAIMALRKEGLLGAETLDTLIGGLTSSKTGLANDAKALAHADLLISLLETANARSQ
ncbi:hypothetical protein [Sphingorhabdus sp.]|jgi:hypothetical protein|uniref:hypothetical protein n=1 Tax=Sphingorhabdus sp. TaxID=1902408 RepID=UPI003BB02583|nr:hypothetical protein [Sphingomonadales bacterium]MBL0021179.1 hypothetical protein [Sphingomonadales bacterium]